jgi:transposase
MVQEAETENTSSYVGIDLGHKTWHACRFSHAGNHEFFSGAMDARGIGKLSRWLKDGDKIAIESGSVSFWFKRAVEEKRQCTIYVLNATELKFIYNSLKKTDKEDSLKLARFIATNPEKALPIVRTPDTNTEYLRKLVSERAEIVRHLASNKSRFYGLCIQAGITSVRKRDLRTAEHMAEIAQKLPQRWQLFAQMIIEQQKLFEAQLAALALHGYGIP